jgi:hypothetical protein
VGDVMELKHPLYTHEFSEIIRSYINSIGIPATHKKVEDRNGDNSISWRFTFNSDAEVLIMLHKEEEGYFIWIHSILARLDRNKAEEILIWLLEQNVDFPHPFKFALDFERDAILLVFRICGDWLTCEHLEFRLQNLWPIVNELQERLVRRFGLRTFQKGRGVSKK